MKTINIQETIKCQDSRNVLIQLGAKTINGIGAMVHPTSANDLQWIFELDYDHDAIEGIVMPIWMSSQYSARLNEILNNQKQSTLTGAPNMNSAQSNLFSFNNTKAILYDPSPEALYFSNKTPEGKEGNIRRVRMKNLISETGAPKALNDLLECNPKTYYAAFEKIVNDQKQRNALILWSLIVQNNNKADVVFPMTPYVSGKETSAFKVAVDMNQEAEILGDSIPTPIGHYYCLDFNFFADSDTVDVAIEIFEDQYLKFDKSYKRVVAIKIVNDRFHEEPDSMENLKNFLYALRKIRDQTGVVFVLMSAMETGYAGLAKGFDLCSFPTNGYTNVGFSGGNGAVKAGLYDSKWLSKRKYKSVLKYFKENGHLPVEGTFGMRIAFTDPETYARDEWNSLAKKVLAEVKNNEAKKIREAVRDGEVRTIKEKFLGSKRKDFADLF